MHRFAAVAALVVLLSLASPAHGGSTPQVVAVAPNPVAADDRGEYLVLSVPARTNLAALSISDGETVARLPNRTLSGRLLVTTDPAALAWSNDTVVELRGRLALANAGETIILRYRSRTVDTVRYERAPEGEVFRETDEGWTWQPPGATDLSVEQFDAVTSKLFILPDSPEVPVDGLRSAHDRLLLAGYTFSSTRVTRELCAAKERNVTVKVLLEGTPVGGLTRRDARHLDRLVDCGVAVRLFAGMDTRYRFHHAKYAIVDDQALVLTENWKPSGTGGRSNRGWGVLVENRSVADSLSTTFDADWHWRDTVDWEHVRPTMSFAETEPTANGSYPTRFGLRPVRAESVRVLVAPDNAESAIVELLEDASESIFVEQVSIGGRGQPFLRASLRAARRGVRVNILLDSSWYVSRDNQALATWLNEKARREGLPLEARLVEPRSRFHKIHAKGVVIDGETVVVGSLNWNNVSARDNREVVLVVTGTEVGGYFGSVFMADWQGGVWRVPLGVGGITLSMALMVGWQANRSFRFEGR